MERVNQHTTYKQENINNDKRKTKLTLFQVEKYAFNKFKTFDIEVFVYNREYDKLEKSAELRKCYDRYTIGKWYKDGKLWYVEINAYTTGI